jgi:hypothetical protein
MSSAKICAALHLGAHEIYLFPGGYEYSLPQPSSLICLTRLKWGMVSFDYV